MEQFKSTTNNLIYILTFSIIGMTVFTLVNYPDTLFKDVFEVFAPLLTGIWGYKFGRSLPEQSGKPSVELVQKEESKIDIASI